MDSDAPAAGHQIPSPRRPGGKRNRQPAADPLPDWVMLDCHMRRARLHDVPSALTAATFTSTGDSIAVALCAAAPPGTSRLHFDWYPKEEEEPSSKTTERKHRRRQGSNTRSGSNSSNEGEGPSSCFGDDPRVAAAHRRCILLRFMREFEDYHTSVGDYHTSVEEWFVYQAHRRRRDGSGGDAAAWTSLTRLPSCGHNFINSESTSTMGILAGPEDDGRFVVAHLEVTPPREPQFGPYRDKDSSSSSSPAPATADLCILRHDHQQRGCRTMRLPIRHGEGERHHLDLWRTDAVVALGDDCICWVDYLRGILLCDVSGDGDPVELRYLSLPIKPYSDGDEHPDPWALGGGGRGHLATFRNVSAVTTAATTTLKFVDMSSHDIWFAGAPEHPLMAPRRNTITSWTLGADRRSWGEAGTVDDDAFYALLIKDARLPIVRPEFPLVDARDHRTIYLLMREYPCSGRDGGKPPANFLIAVDMASKTIVGCLPHTLTENLSSSSTTPSYNTVSCNLYQHEPFIPSEFSKYLQ